MELEKIELRVEDEDGSVNVETLWAFNLGDDTYQLDNSPFYAYGVSIGDIVQADPVTGDAFPIFRCVIKKSGNKTIRIIFHHPVEKGNPSEAVLNRLTALGCSYEGANKIYVAVTIPTEVDLVAICGYLQQEHDLQWEHADPYL